MPEWPIATLREVCVDIYDGPHATPPKTDAGPIFLGISCLSDGRLDLSQAEHVSADSFKKWTRRVTPGPEDIVFSYETRIGQAAMIPQGLQCCLGRRLALLRPDPARISPRFLLYYYLSPDFQDFLRSRTISGSTVERIALTEVPGFPIALPPLNEQNAIANLLGALDDKIELNQRMIGTLEAMAAMLFGKWCDDNGPATATVCAEELIDRGVLLINDGYRAKNSEMAASGLPFARAGNLQNHFDFRNADLLGDAGVRAAREKVSETFDCVFTSKGTVGRIAQVLPRTRRFVYSPQLCFWRALQPDFLNPLILNQWMHGDEFREQIDAVKGQTDMADYVSLRDQRRMHITLPFCADQTSIGERLEYLALMQDANRTETSTLAALRDTLLPQLLSGAIRPRDAQRAVASAA